MPRGRKKCLGRKELAKRVAERLGLAEGDVSTVVDWWLAEICQELRRGEQVTVSNFGTLRVRTTAIVRKQGRYACELPEHRRVTFRAAGALRRLLNEAR